MNDKKLLITLFSLLTIQSASANFITIENLSDLPISIQSASKLGQWKPLNPKKKTTMNTWFKDVPGILWKEVAKSPSGNVVGCAYYYVSINQSGSVLSKSHIKVYNDGKYEDGSNKSLRDVNKKQAKLVTVDKKCNSFNN